MVVVPILILPVAMFVTEATLGLLVLVVIIIIPGMVLMLDPELLPVLVMKDRNSCCRQHWKHSTCSSRCWDWS